MDSNSGILSENTKANYTERYDSLLKMKNHVSIYNIILKTKKWTDPDTDDIFIESSSVLTNPIMRNQKKNNNY